MSSVVIDPSMSLATADPVEAGCRVDVVEDYQALLGLREEWDALLAQSTVTHPFSSHAWFRAWWECFGGDKAPYVLVVRVGAKPIAIAPFMLSRARIYGVGVQRLSFMENDHTPRCDLIVSSGSEAQACRAIWDFLRRDTRWDVAELNHLPAGGVALERLAALARSDRFLTGTRPLEQSPYVPLDGDWEGYVKQLGYNHRRNTRKRFNRLKRRGRVELEVVTGNDAAALDEGLRIEAAAWKEQNGTAMRSDPTVRRFYELYAERSAALGTLRLMFLKIDGVRIAFCYALLEYNRLHVLKAGYDPAYSRYTPYQLLCHLVLQDGFARGLSEYDFLGHNEAWKLEWKPQLRPHHGLLVFRRSPVAHLLYALKCRVVPLLQRQPLYLSVRERIVDWRRPRNASSAASEPEDDESA